jgi:hypothetical protein
MAESPGLPRELEVTLRYGFPDDAPAISRLAALDSATPPPAPLLLAEVGGELWAALSLTDGVAIADPFRPSAELLELLRRRARQLSHPRGINRRRGAWRSAPAALALATAAAARLPRRRTHA